VEILLDRELELYPTIYPAAGTDATGVPLTFALLAEITGGRIVDLPSE
jgi:prolyl-tRNA editing enzyme YbaK/EbsC (Cys-tRNA(Pro) deacylase)